MAEYKYVCEPCKYKTNYKSQWDKHIETEKHRTGKRKMRSDKKCPDKCPHCDYSNKNNTNMKLHILNKHSTKEERKAGFKYYCEYCDFGNFAKCVYDKHLNSKKHKLIMKIVEENKET